MGVLEIIILLAAIINFFLGLFVFVKDPSKRINRLFGISGLITGIWVFTNFMIGIQKTLFWLKSAYAFGSFVPIAAMLWGLELCEKKITRREIFLLLGVGLFFFVISYSNNLIVTNVTRVYLGGFEGETGPFFISYWIYIFGILAFILYILSSSYFKAAGINKIQIGYVLLGAILYISVVIIVDFILPLFGIKELIPLDSPSSLFLLFFTALAITRVHLFGIRLILTETLVVATGLTLLVWAVTAEPFLLKILGGALFVFFIVFGYQLVKSVIKEIELRTQLKQAYDELERIDKAKTEFLSIASHQLRTPLSIIKGYISMILEKTYGEIPEKIKQPLGNVYVSNDRLVKLVNDLLDITRLEMGRIELSLEKAHLEEIISSVVEEMKVTAEKKGLYLKYEALKEPLPEISVDKTKIRQVILNLVDNAIKYTQKGGVTVKVRKMNSEVRIEVRDTGVGMSKEEIGNLFEIMRRGRAGFQYWTEGAGLGLYIAKKFLEMHGGRIWAESPGKDKGSTFYIELPVK